VGREPSGLDLADSYDRVPNAAVAVVYVEDEGHVLPTGAQGVPSDPCSGCRVVYPPGQVETCLRYSVRPDLLR
jgi:hypothetical protein